MNAINPPTEGPMQHALDSLAASVAALPVASQAEADIASAAPRWERVAGLEKDAGLPRRALAVLALPTLAAPAEWSAARAKILAQKNGTLVLMGPKGTGKTVLAVAVALALIRERLVRVHYTPLLKLMLRFEAARRDGASESRLDVLQELAAVGLLIIDEVDKGFDTDAEKRVIFALLDDRHNSMRPTLLISHPPYGSFSAWAGPELVDRINETGGRIKCNWPAMRSGSKPSLGPTTKLSHERRTSDTCRNPRRSLR